MRVTLIPSGKYCETEICAEYGLLPPSFLPIGHQRLYEKQIEQLQIGGYFDDIYLTLPKSFILESADEGWLSEKNVKIIYVPENLSLSQSILYALNLIEENISELRILHGDTLIYDLDLNLLDSIVISSTSNAYQWGSPIEDAMKLDKVHSESITLGYKNILAGYFSFGSASLFRSCLALAGDNFLLALDLYSKKRPLKNVFNKNWLDFGHLQTYYQSRCSIKTQRSFNSLDIDFRKITKSGDNSAKINLERLWFERIPSFLRTYTPALLGFDNSSDVNYSLEYLATPSLNELFVFGKLDRNIWHKIIGGCFEYLTDASKVDLSTYSLDYAQLPLQLLVVDKTHKRLGSFMSQAGICDGGWRYEGIPLPCLTEIASITAEHINFAENKFLGCMHGDFCFTNIFYEFRTNKIKVIDPRGSIDDHNPSIVGDLRYDLAKLNHSIMGYDLILSERYHLHGWETKNVGIKFELDGPTNWLPKISEQFLLHDISLSDSEIQAITIHLFMSMLPLHSDRPDRQKAFLVNALRLYYENFQK